MRCQEFVSRYLVIFGVTFFSGVVIRKMLVAVDSNDDNYMPSHIVVMGGIDAEHLKLLANTKIDISFTGDVCILEDAATFYPCLEIRIKGMGLIL